MTRLEHITYLTKLLSDWNQSNNKELSKYKIEVASSHIKLHKIIISDMVNSLGKDLTSELFDEIRFHPNHFQEGMLKAIEAINTGMIIDQIPSELEQLRNYLETNKSLNFLERHAEKLIDKYSLQNYDAAIRSSVHDTDEFIFNCESIIFKLRTKSN